MKLKLNSISTAPGAVVLYKDLLYKSKETWYKFKFAMERLLEPSVSPTGIHHLQVIFEKFYPFQTKKNWCWVSFFVFESGNPTSSRIITQASYNKKTIGLATAHTAAVRTHLSVHDTAHPLSATCVRPRLAAEGLIHSNADISHPRKPGIVCKDMPAASGFCHGVNARGMVAVMLVRVLTQWQCAVSRWSASSALLQDQDARSSVDLWVQKLE